MPQVFRRSSNTLFMVSVLGTAGIVISALLIWHGSMTSPTAQDEPIVQPVPFSHKHHVSDDGIDCRYCHTSVETSAYADVPSTHICMSCHSQLFTDTPVLQPVVGSYTSGKRLQWTRVNDLPDFVYFNHGIHVSKGVGCATCHGPVDQMPLTWRGKPLTMQWCLNCHRAPERYLRPVSEVFNMNYRPPQDQLALGRRLMKQNHVDTAPLTDCSTCHR